ncbi:MAG: hypothetical protein IJO94_02805 [Firmicutes bacterium]|nr:hypothetical protein [Bacillota bacterium]
MYRCQNCKQIFEEIIENRHFERSGEELDPPSYHCPHCHSEDFEPVEYCKICEKWEYSGYIYDGVCKSCLSRIETKIKDLIYRNCTVMEVDAARNQLEIGGIL